MTSQQQKHGTAKETAAEWLRSQVAALPWDQEAFLNENAIAEASGLSRTPVREALMQLTTAGLLRRVPHKGAYIPALTEADLEEILEIRTVIGSWATRKVTEQRLIDVAALQLKLDAQKAVLDDPKAFIAADIAFHQSIVNAAHNERFSMLYQSQSIRQERLGIQALLGSRGRSQEVLNEHQDIIDAIATGNGDLAEAAAIGHLHSTRTALENRRNPGLN